MNLILFLFFFPSQMALLPEGITELLHHEKLIVPLVCIWKVTYDSFVFCISGQLEFMILY